MPFVGYLLLAGALLLLAAMAGVALVRPNLKGHLTMGLCALFVGYFALAGRCRGPVGRTSARSGTTGVDFHYAYGAYLGVAGGIVALLAAAVLPRDELVRRRSASQAAALVPGVGLLVSFLLPWQRVAAARIEEPAALLAAVTV